MCPHGSWRTSLAAHVRACPFLHLCSLFHSCVPVLSSLTNDFWRQSTYFLVLFLLFSFWFAWSFCLCCSVHQAISEEPGKVVGGFIGCGRLESQRAGQEAPLPFCMRRHQIWSEEEGVKVAQVALRGGHLRPTFSTRHWEPFPFGQLLCWGLPTQSWLFVRDLFHRGLTFLVTLVQRTRKHLEALSRGSPGHLSILFLTDSMSSVAWRLLFVFSQPFACLLP